MEIVVNDTNIFFDLLAVDLLDIFFDLPIEIHTTDFVINEITDPKQLEIIMEYVDRKQLLVFESDFDFYSKIFELKEKVPGLSPTDCSVWHLSKIRDLTLLSGDKLLRNTALRDKVKVKGILYIFESLINGEMLSYSKAADKLEELINSGSRLPLRECKRRIEIWRNI